eukprot:g4143.t1
MASLLGTTSRSERDLEAGGATRTVGGTRTGYSDSENRLELPQEWKHKNRANVRMDYSKVDVKMDYWTNEFVDDPELEKVYHERRWQFLPNIRIGAMLAQGLLLLYFLVNVNNLFSGADRVRALYKISYPVRFVALLISFSFTYLLKGQMLKSSWQDVIVFAVLLPISATMFFNGYKYYNYINFYDEDIDVVTSALNVSNSLLTANMTDKLLVTDKVVPGDTVNKFLSEVVGYWAEKTVTSSNRIWPPMMLVIMLVLQIDFTRCAYSGAFSFVFWYFVTGYSAGSWFPGKGVMLVGGITIALLYACRISDRLSRRNFIFESTLRLENESIKDKLDQIAKYAEATDDEKRMVAAIVGGAHERNHEMHTINFDDLELEQIIGAGASGEVIKAKYLGTIVVVKRMLRSNMTEENVKAFTKEAELMNGLRHPNIVQFIGSSFNTHVNLCVVLEWVERGDLFNLLRSDMGQDLQWSDPLLKMAIDCACGMAYLHGCRPPVIHRDLKSLNILVTSTFGCKITDFGMSRQSEAQKGMDMAMTLVGTPLWVPPEVIKSEKYSEKIDVYSFGICLTEMETREMPYADLASQEGMTKWKLLNMIAKEGIRPTMPPRNQMNRHIRDLIDDCLKTSPSARPSMEDCLQRLQGECRRSIEAEAREASRRAALHRVNSSKAVRGNQRVVQSGSVHPSQTDMV